MKFYCFFSGSLPSLSSCVANDVEEQVRFSYSEVTIDVIHLCFHFTLYISSCLDNKFLWTSHADDYDDHGPLDQDKSS